MANEEKLAVGASIFATTRISVHVQGAQSPQADLEGRSLARCEEAEDGCFNFGGNAAGTPQSREKHVLDASGRPRRSTHLVPRPVLVAEAFDCLSAVDVHNHIRQGSVRLEETWRCKTKNWWHRQFASIMSILMVNAYLAYSALVRLLPKKMMTIRVFIDKVARYLINLNPQNTHRADKEEIMESSDSESDLDSEEQHSSAPIEDPEPPVLPPVVCERCECRAGQIPLRKQLRCKYCGALTRRCCAGCSIPHFPFAVCSTNISCWDRHRRQLPPSR